MSSFNLIKEKTRESCLYMRLHPFFISTVFSLLLLCGTILLQAQSPACTFKPPLLTIDFGTDKEAIPGINTFRLPNYSLDESICPNDGYYSFVSHTSECFNGDWLTFNEDHTPNDTNGRMMLVNASPEGGVFFKTLINSLQPNTTYELSAWMINVCKISGGCPPLPPDISIKLETAAGKKVVYFQTGLLAQNARPHWQKYDGMFTTPADLNTLVLSMEDMTTGGCGNDFALDDIMIRECVKTPLKDEVKPIINKVTATSKPPVKKEQISTPPLKKNMPALPVEKTVISAPEPKPVLKEKPIILPAPSVILTRENPVVKQIETDAGEISVDLYDNGEIDGDTVTVYHNNELIVSRAGLSAKPIHFNITVDGQHPYHELVMVANNLGSIPPNTSLMIVKTTTKRYEVFISSTEQQNAKIIINLKKE